MWGLLCEDFSICLVVPFRGNIFVWNRLACLDVGFFRCVYQSQYWLQNCFPWLYKFMLVIQFDRIWYYKNTVNVPPFWLAMWGLLCEDFSICPVVPFRGNIFVWNRLACLDVGFFRCVYWSQYWLQNCFPWLCKFMLVIQFDRIWYYKNTVNSSNCEL